MKTLTPIEALEGAIEMLRAIQDGKSYPVFEWVDRLVSYEDARDAHRAAEAADECKRLQIRALSAAARDARQKSHPASIGQGFAPAVPDRGPMLVPGDQL